MLRTIKCPECLAYAQGDFKSREKVPTHYTAAADDLEMDVENKFNQSEVCLGSGRKVHTTPSEKET